MYLKAVRDEILRRDVVTAPNVEEYLSELFQLPEARIYRSRYQIVITSIRFVVFALVPINV